MAAPQKPNAPVFDIDDAISDALSDGVPETAKLSLEDDHPIEKVEGFSTDDDAAWDAGNETRVSAMTPEMQKSIEITVSRKTARLQPLPEGVTAQLLFDDRRISITKSLTIIGRVNDVSDIAFPDDDQISRAHAAVAFVNGEFVIEDLDSTNGTFLQGKRVKRAALGPNAEVRVGRRTFKLLVG
jgi:pSer/pThr/pTyr-binding forkhead associated (FHA) protein